MQPRTRTIAHPPARLWRLLIALISTLALAPAALPEALAATPQHIRLLPDEQAAGNGEFGSAIALSADTLVVGEPASDYSVLLGGAAEVYVREATGWRREAVLTAPDGHYSAKFGAAVAISGDTLAVGAPQQNAGASYAGQVYIYTRSGGVWSLQRILSEGQANYHSFFGRSLAMEGSRIAVGADEIGSGKIYIYQGGGADWAIETILGPDASANLGGFGAGVAMRDGTLVTAARGLDAAYAFTLGPSGWGPAQKLTVDRSAERWPNPLGAAVAVAGDTLVFGAFRYNTTTSPGAAYVFTRVGGTWEHTATLSEADDTEFGSFGSAFAIDGDRLLVGAPQHHLEGHDIPNLLGVWQRFV